MPSYFSFSFAYCSSEIPEILAASTSLAESLTCPRGRGDPVRNRAADWRMTRLDGLGRWRRCLKKLRRWLHGGTFCLLAVELLIKDFPNGVVVRVSATLVSGLVCLSDCKRRDVRVIDHLWMLVSGNAPRPHSFPIAAIRLVSVPGSGAVAAAIPPPARAATLRTS